jgi:hypothetical protein
MEFSHKLAIKILSKKDENGVAEICASDFGVDGDVFASQLKGMVTAKLISISGIDESLLIELGGIVSKTTKIMVTLVGEKYLADNS